MPNRIPRLGTDIQKGPEQMVKREVITRPRLDIGALVAGDVVRHQPGRTITEFDDMLVALLTVNLAPLHIDAAYASKTLHGRRIVNGLLIASIAVGLSNQDFAPDTATMLTIDAIDHYTPTFYGNTIYCSSEVRETRGSDGDWVLSVRTSVVNEDDELLMTVDRPLLCRNQQVSS